jgi:hypothetical protein
LGDDVRGGFRDGGGTLKLASEFFVLAFGAKKLVIADAPSTGVAKKSVAERASLTQGIGSEARLKVIEGVWKVAGFSLT